MVMRLALVLVTHHEKFIVREAHVALACSRFSVNHLDHLDKQSHVNSPEERGRLGVGTTAGCCSTLRFLLCGCGCACSSMSRGLLSKSPLARYSDPFRSIAAEF